ncbi:MAG: hypothetical protein QM779_11480 [Propionicimonas sp.]|uniref:hypothetical protein n=1 Tax=Propionicimonas sp. TaxID=1955623 RepID=UPI003D0DC76D
MKAPILILLAACAALSLTGCESPGWGKTDSVSITNNSDQTIVLKRPWIEPTPDPVATATPGQTTTAKDAIVADRCQDNWLITDTSGKTLRTLSSVCAGQTITYP